MSVFRIGDFIQHLLVTIPAGVYACIAPTGTIIRFNRRAVELWGCVPLLKSCDELFCASCRLFNLDGTFMPFYRCPMADALSGNEVRDRRLVLERPNGVRVEVSVNTLSLRRTEEQVIGSVNVFEDVTKSDPARLAKLVETFGARRAMAAHN